VQKYIKRWNVQRRDERGMQIQTCQTNDVLLWRLPPRANLTCCSIFFFFYTRRVRFSFDRYKNSIATQVRSGSTILSSLRSKLANFQASAETNISRSRFPSRISSFCLFFARARVIREGRCVTAGATERFSRCVCVSTYRSPICNEFL